MEVSTPEPGDSRIVVTNTLREPRSQACLTRFLRSLILGMLRLNARAKKKVIVMVMFAPEYEGGMTEGLLVTS
jgi:hypothetical protein